MNTTMNKLLPLLLTLALSACSTDKAAEQAPADAPTTQPAEEARTDVGMYNAAAGVMHQVTDGVWAIQPENNAEWRLCAQGEAMSEAIQVEGQRVRFSGEMGVIPDNVRMACHPFTLTMIEVVAE
jgi:uncharacterized lipoprotein